MLILLFVIYALVFMEIFGLTKFKGFTNDHSNFRSFLGALLTLFRMMTGENWQYLMYSTIIEPPYCTVGSNYLDTDCGSTIWSYLLFISFFILCCYILLNLFIAVSH